MSGTASASLLSGLTSTVTNLTAPATSPITLQSGVTQLANGVTGLLTGAQAALVSGQSVVSGFQTTLTPSIAGNITSLQTALQHTAADAAALDTTASQADLMAAVTAIQSAATGEVGALSGVALTQALTNGLSVAQQVVSPICSLLGVPAALAAGVGVDLTRFYPLSTAIPVVDQATNNLLTSTYASLYDAITATVPAQLGTSGAVVSALLTLLKYNWTTTYYPPNGGAPVVRSTKALLDVPTPIDVDGSGSYDLCATTTLALDATSGQLKVSQQITKLPLSPAVLPVDVSGALLGVIGFGYETKNSTAPINFTSNIAVPGTNGNVIETDNTYTVFRGMTLTLPPLLNNFTSQALPFGLGNATLPNVPALLVPAPTPKITQVVSIGGSALQFRFRHDNEPGATHVGVKVSAPSEVAYTGSGLGDGFGFATKVSTLALGTNTTPAPASFDMCGSTTTAVCNPTSVDAATDKGSLGLTASQVVQADQFVTGIPGITGTETACPAIAVADAHLHGSYFRMSQTPISVTLPQGKLSVDTGDQPVDGCVAAAGLPVSTLPVGFKANKRHAVYHAPNIPDAKTGTITCPTGTIVGTFTGTICFLPPVNTTAPFVVNPAWVGTPTAGNPGVWSPPAPNTPLLTNQWQRCAGDGSACATIAGAIGSTYTPVASDIGKTLRFSVTGTNLDGAVTVTSAPSALVSNPPPPVNTAKPTIGGLLGVGNTLTASTGTWDNPVAGYAYQWRRCTDPDNIPASCVDIGGATTNTYVAAVADKGRALVVVVTASNPGGSASATSPPVEIPNDPLNGAVSVPDGAVSAIVPSSGGASYIGGAFDTVGPPAGGAGAVGNSTTTGTLTPALTANATGGAVSAELSDGSGGYFIGGSFTKVRGVACAGLAHVLADGSVDSAYCLAGLAGEVRALDVTNGVVVVGGNFTYAGHHNLVFLAGGALLEPTTAGDPDGAVNAIADNSGDLRKNVFIGGDFTNIGSTPAGHLAMYQLATTPSLAVSRPAYYWSVGCSAAPVAGTTCAAPGAAATVNSIAFSHTGTASTATAPAGTSEILVGGVFDSVHAANGTLNNSTSTGSGSTTTTTFTPGNAPTGLDSVVTARQNAVAFGEFTLRFLATPTAANPGGNFVSTGTATANATNFLVYLLLNPSTLAADQSPSILAWNPNANGAVNAIAVKKPFPTGTTANSVYLAGSFNSLGVNGSPVTGTNQNAVADSGVAEFGISSAGGNGSAAKGTAGTSSPSTTWAPAVNGSVRSLLVDGTGVYLGGSFTTAAAQPRGRAAFLTPAGAAAPTLGSWDPHAGKAVNALAGDGTNVFIGGAFNVLNGVTRNNLAEISPSTGVTSWNPNADGPVSALATDAGGIYAGGSFANAGGQPRANVAKLDTSGAATAWNPGTNGTVEAIAVDGADVYLGGAFTAHLAKVTGGLVNGGFSPAVDGPVHALLNRSTGIVAGGSFATAGGAARSNIAELDHGTGLATGASFGGGTNGAVNALAGSATATYAGGSFSSAGGSPRVNLAAFDASGAPNGWNPGANDTVKALANANGTIYAGGAFTAAAGKTRSHVVGIDPASGLSTLFNPGLDGSVLSISSAASGPLTLGGTWQNVGAVFAPSVATFGGS